MKYDNNLWGALFKNHKKEGQQPDYQGNCEIEGKEYWISGWVKDSKDGKKYMRLQFKPKDSGAPF